MLHNSYLTVALNPIMTNLTVDAGTVQWVTTAYMLVAAVTVPVTGFLYRKAPTQTLFSAVLAFC
ncbi:hypothetical protein [Cryptobacterium curtum]|uniref:hypothetical protein n=1 Tax=Cryptobacterium curtum TaxID=84163 RepID=UPI00248F44B3|nr:hypothetical protein [Cryptobacterium curtum]